ncbi:discoidin domain-containing protein [[Mycoplasma] testudinis]|uniref:discoidin domain-containing protein n=1 Tax=[Mycoplasma] testudinis TaxID=33924 RepID=UPI000483B168|nr:discoidin domain-containing protein [[Mycoplasma] testudinis]
MCTIASIAGAILIVVPAVDYEFNSNSLLRPKIQEEKIDPDVVQSQNSKTVQEYYDSLIDKTFNTTTANNQIFPSVFDFKDGELLATLNSQLAQTFQVPDLPSSLPNNFQIVLNKVNTDDYNGQLQVRIIVEENRDGIKVFYNTNGQVISNQNVAGRTITISGFKANNSFFKLKTITNVNEQTFGTQVDLNVNIDGLITKNQVIEYLQAVKKYNLIDTFVKTLTDNKTINDDLVNAPKSVRLISFNPEVLTASGSKEDFQSYSANGYSLVVGGRQANATDPKNGMFDTQVGNGSDQTTQFYVRSSINGVNGLTLEVQNLLSKDLFTNFWTDNPYQETPGAKVEHNAPDYVFTPLTRFFLTNRKTSSTQSANQFNIKVAIPSLTTTQQVIWYLQALVHYDDENNTLKQAFLQQISQNGLNGSSTYWFSLNPEGTNEEIYSADGSSLIIGGHAYNTNSVVTSTNPAFVNSLTSGNGMGGNSKIQGLDGLAKEWNSFINQPLFNHLSLDNPYQNKPSQLNLQVLPLTSATLITSSNQPASTNGPWTFQVGTDQNVPLTDSRATAEIAKLNDGNDGTFAIFIPQHPPLNSAAANNRNLLANDWIGFDYKTVQTIQKIHIVNGNYTNSQNNFSSNYSVQYTTDDPANSSATWTTFENGSFQNGRSFADIYLFDKPIQARAVRIINTQPKNAWWNIGEFAIYVVQPISTSSTPSS